MSFTISLYQNASPDKKIGKTLTPIGTYTGELRNETSILTPTILLEDSGTLYNANYMYIAEFGRYYYIKDINKVRNGLIEITSRCDATESWKDRILSHKAVVERQENKWNLYLDDGTFKSYNNPILITKQFPSGFSGMSFLLVVAGDQV